MKAITVSGPLGNLYTARVADPATLTQFKIGDKIVLILTEAVAISLEKVTPKATP